ncbi:hypothetical protein ES708_09307 [subsurface metagenome]
MNKNQKIVLAIFIPIIIFFIALMIANSVGVTGHWHISKPIAGYKTHTSIRYTHNPFDWEKTWYVWLVYSAFCCLFEFLLFRDKKREIERTD